MRTAIVCLMISAFGCGGSGPADSGPNTPLTVADWKAMPVEQKYSGETLERLKKGDPNLDTAEGWEAFQKTVIAPSRKKDFPGGKR
jgi:hypothetical protein